MMCLLLRVWLRDKRVRVFCQRAIEFAVNPIRLCISKVTVDVLWSVMLLGLRLVISVLGVVVGYVVGFGDVSSRTCGC